MPERRRGGPFALLGILLVAWIAARAAFWENPFPSVSANPAMFAGEAGTEAWPDRAGSAPAEPRMSVSRSPPAIARTVRAARAVVPSPAALSPFSPRASDRVGMAGSPSGISAAHQHLLRAAMRTSLAPRGYGALRTSGEMPLRAGKNAPAFAPPASSPGESADRWSLDAWAFWRAGSNGAPISEGRVPIYGASQIGGTLRWQARPNSPHDPRLFARAYRALVTRGENELAMGASARPMPNIPVRVAGEVRITDGAQRTEIRPAAFAVTEIAPLALPFDLGLEAYGQAGYVGGRAATPFADGQVMLSREILRFDSGIADRARMSIGGGAWGGAQKGASRLDVGPSMRLDMSVGEVPARISVDWRERVGGDALPARGLSATLSTRF